jgi:hypothetical protein
MSNRPITRRGLLGFGLQAIADAKPKLQAIVDKPPA